MVKLTIQNVKNFAQGTFRLAEMELGLLDQHILEQAAYRESLCPDCAEAGKCVGCGCSVPGRWFSDPSCSKNRYPAIMEIDQWEQYKKDNNIEITV